MKAQRGFTIIEVLVACTLSTVLMGIAVAVIILLMQTESTWRRQCSDNLSTQRLVDQFRQDVYQAHDLQPIEPATTDPPTQCWRLSLSGDRMVEYQIEATRLQRTEIVSGKVSMRESFPLVPGSRVSVTLENQPAAPLVSLKIVPGSPRAGRLAQRPIVVEAIMGSNNSTRESR